MSNPHTAEYRVSARRVFSPTQSTSRSRPVRRWRLLDYVVLVMSLLNLIGVLALCVMLCVLSEDWWFSLVLSYLPRIPWAVPALLLTIASLLLRRRMAWINLFSLLLVLGPIMGFRAPLSAWLSGGGNSPLTVVSYNIKGNGADVEKVVQEIVAAEPDLFVLQEATIDPRPLGKHFEDWHFLHAGEYLVGARWPVTMKDACRTEGFRRATAILCEVAHPDGPILVMDVHLTTARYGLTRIRPDSPVSGEGVESLLEHQRLREQEAAGTSEFLDALDPETPLLVLGDFNMPVSSSLFQQHWGDLTSAFDAAGWGYGYTAPCNTSGNYWPPNRPWLRIDHILLSSHWYASDCWIGTSDASDHRCIVARVARR